MKTALLFDLDGTLIDSDALHEKAFADLLAPYGINVDAAFYRAKIHGRLNADIFGELLPDEDALWWADHKEAVYRDMLGAEHPNMPGLLALLDLADAMGWPMGVVTNAPRNNAEAVLEALGISERFQTLVIGDECARGKPYPDPYLEGLRRLDATPLSSIAFEDSPSGIRSAVEAGLKTIGIRSMLDDETLRAAGAAASIADYADPALQEHIDQLKEKAA